MAYEVVTKTLAQRRYSIDGGKPKMPQKKDIPIVEPQIIEDTVPTEPVPLPTNELSDESVQEEVEPFSFENEDAYFTIDTPVEEPQESKKTKKTKTKKTKKKIEIFEPEDEDEVKMKQHLEEAINGDGYYDEIKPRDDGQIIHEKKKINVWLIAAIAGLLIFSVIMIVYGIGSLAR